MIWRGFVAVEGWATLLAVASFGWAQTVLGMIRRILVLCLLVQVNATRPGAASTKSGNSPGTTMLYHESLRPQFHFTSRGNWLNDPNGLVYFDGEYHLFFQHNPSGNEWGNMTWGHAVSPDLLHWRQLDDALKPDALGTTFSGSAVVDRDNTAGFQSSAEPAMVAIYTAAGGTSEESKGKPFTQCLAYSNDRGRTWTKYAGNPVLGTVAEGNRDPKVVWYAPTRRWIMALYKSHNDFALFSSSDLKVWTHLQDLAIPGSEECPDFFEMDLDRETKRPRWIFTTANGRYLVGQFDGQRFIPEAGPYPSDFGANYYAMQSWSSTPDGRRIQIAWMRGGKYPGMPFNQQMSFPCELSLRTTAEGPRLFRTPVREIESLYAGQHELKNLDLKPGGVEPLSGIRCDGVDVTVELLPRGEESEIDFSVHGHALMYSAKRHELSFLGRSMVIHPAGDGTVRLRFLIDRTSVEVFADDGLSVLSSCFVPIQGASSLRLQAKRGSAMIAQLDLHSLKSAW
jgi:sucrose-6-phosphate hydrolase SacC (GH32 family)